VIAISFVPSADCVHDRAKDAVPEAAGDACAPAPASDADAAASDPSTVHTKRPRDDGAAAAAGSGVRQKQADGPGWDCVRVHRVGTAGSCRPPRRVVDALCTAAPRSASGVRVKGDLSVQDPAALGCVCLAPSRLSSPKCAPSLLFAPASAATGACARSLSVFARFLT
jgi:hypothetical protein